MALILDPCPLCFKGSSEPEPRAVEFWRCGDGKLVLRCFGCNNVWLDPAKVAKESAVTPIPFTFVVPGLESRLGGRAAGLATLGEIEDAGWLSCVDMDY